MKRQPVIVAAISAELHRQHDEEGRDFGHAYLNLKDPEHAVIDAIVDLKAVAVAVDEALDEGLRS